MGSRVVSPRNAPIPATGGGCGAFIGGFLLATVLAAIAVFFFYYFQPDYSPVLQRPPEQSGVPDINATVSETFLNREIHSQLSGNAVKAGPIDIKNVLIKIKGEAAIEVQLQASTGPIDFDVAVTEQVIIQNGAVKLKAVGQPVIIGGKLPPALNSLLDVANTQFIEPQINKQLAHITIDGQTLKLLSVASTPGLLTVKANI